MAELGIGDIVRFKGTQHYANTTDEIGIPCTGGIAKIDQIVGVGLQTIHVIAEGYVSEERSDVYGWVRWKDIEELDAKTLGCIAVDKLVSIGLITSPDYWKTFIKDETVKGTEYLIAKAAKYIIENKVGSISTNDAVNKLVEVGVVTAPDYWKGVAAWYPNIASLLQKLALSLESVKQDPTDIQGNESYNRQRMIEFAQSYLGYNEWDGSHRRIVDAYNAHRPLAQGYLVKYTDSWCATFVSFCAIKLGFTSIIPTECSCERQINLFKDMGRWQEDERYTPMPGDIIYYAWNDDWNYQNTDNRRFADHVGIVVKVDWNGDILVIEGNKNDCVEYRTVKVNGKFIRGYGLPNYASV